MAKIVFLFVHEILTPEELELVPYIPYGLEEEGSRAPHMDVKKHYKIKSRPYFYRDGFKEELVSSGYATRVEADTECVVLVEDALWIACHALGPPDTLFFRVNRARSRLRKLFPGWIGLATTHGCSNYKDETWPIYYWHEHILRDKVVRIDDECFVALISYFPQRVWNEEGYGTGYLKDLFDLARALIHFSPNPGQCRENLYLWYESLSKRYFMERYRPELIAEYGAKKSCSEWDAWHKKSQKAYCEWLESI